MHLMTDQTPPVSHCTCFRLRKLSRLVTQRYDRALTPLGLNLNQYSILRRAAREPRPIGDLARELGMDRTTLSRDIRPLAAAGWIELVTGAADARQRCIRVTPAGAALLEDAQPRWRQVQDAVDALLGPGIGSLHEHLDHAIHKLEGRSA
jgi:DNA-binding MarR family transcriptional regulator